MSQYSSNFDISQLKVENPSGIVSTGARDATQTHQWSIGMRPLNLEFITLLDIDNIGSSTNINPWYGFSVSQLEDQNTVAYGKYQPLIMDDISPYEDYLSPIGWKSYDFDFEYSTNAYYLGDFEEGDMFGITITSKEDYLSQDVMFGFTDYALAQKLLNQSENGDNDNDGDGVPDDVDTDDDDDGILDQIDQFPLDSDDDGIPNKDDDDDDGNGILDEDEVWLGSDVFNLPSQETRRGIFWIEEDTPREIGMFFASIESGTHPLEGTFGYEIEFWSLPEPDSSEGGIFNIAEDIEYDFWIANIDTSDNFSLEFANDEAMKLVFSSDDVIYENSTFANYTCLSTGQEFSFELTSSSEVPLECDAPFDEIEIEISTTNVLVHYTLNLVRSESRILLKDSTPAYGISQSEITTDQWLVEESVHDQLLHMFSDSGATVSFYDETGLISSTTVGQNYDQVPDDSDNDGWTDSWELACLSSADDSSEQPIDADFDGVCDALDAFPNDGSMNQILSTVIVPSSTTWFEILDTSKYGILLASTDSLDFSLENIEYIDNDEIEITFLIEQSLLLSSVQGSNYPGYAFNILSPELEVDSLEVAGSEAGLDQRIERYGEAFVDSGARIYATFLAAPSDAVDGIISGTFTVSSSWYSSNHEYEFEVSINSAPILNGPESVVLEILDDATTLQFNGTDVDGDVLEFSIESDQTEIQIHSETGIVSWKPTTPGDYLLTVIVSDGIFEDRMTVKITVNELALPPAVYGCMDPTATNYNPEATESDSSCTYSEPVDDDVDDVVDDNSDQEQPNNQGDVDKDSTTNDEKSSESTTKMAMQILAIIGIIVLGVLLTLAFTRSKHQELIGDEFGYGNVSLDEYGQVNTYTLENQTTEVQDLSTVQPPSFGHPPTQDVVEESSGITDHYELDGRAESPSDTTVSSVAPQGVGFVPPGYHENRSPPVGQPSQNEAPKASERVGFAPPGFSSENKSSSGLPNSQQTEVNVSRVESYEGLIGGGEYYTNERGIIYVDPNNDQWLQQGDGSYEKIT